MIKSGKDRIFFHVSITTYWCIFEFISGVVLGLEGRMRLL